MQNSLNLTLVSLFICVILLIPAGAGSQNFPSGYDDALKQFQQKKYDNSLEIIRLNFQPESQSYEFRMLAAANYLNLANHQQALQHLNFCRREHTDRSEPITLTAVILRKSGNLYGAAREIIAGLARFPDDVPLRMEMSRVYFLLGKYPQARLQLDLILKSDPYNIHAIYLDGLIFIKERRFDEAEFRLSNVLGMKAVPFYLLPSLHNNLGFVLENIASVNVQNGDAAGAKIKYREAMDHYSKALSYSPDNKIYMENKNRISSHL